MRYCQESGCLERADRSGLCWTHYNRRRGQSNATGPVTKKLSPWERLAEAALNYAAADSEDDYQRATHGLRNAAKQYRRNG